jgi:dipeptidyl aminopeptidase/acylaminoacyl peptidase
MPKTNSPAPASRVPKTTALPFQLTRFDRVVAGVIGILVLLILGSIALGDRVGVTLQRVDPLGNSARSTSNIVFQFSEPMQRDTVLPTIEVVQIPAPLANTDFSTGDVLAVIGGEVSWTGSTANFRPSQVLQPGATYQVRLRPGAISESGRAVLQEYRFSFSVRSPRIAYLAPANSVPYNLWITDPASGETEQVTNSPSGLYDYDVSPDGTRIAFAERNSRTGTMDIKVVTLATGAVEQVTNCADSECRTPRWRPDGLMIAYERVDLNRAFDQVGISPSRIWLSDLSSQPATNRPLLDDSQVLGYGLRWSADGNRVSFYDTGSLGIVIYDFRDGALLIIPSNNSSPGELSPDGTQIVVPQIVLTEMAYSMLSLINLDLRDPPRPLTEGEGTYDDDTAVWSPDGSFLVIGRRLVGGRAKMVYLMNPLDGSTEPLITDERYQNGAFRIDPTGTQLVVQRFPDPVAMNDPSIMGNPEIWTYNMETGDLVQIVENAFIPQWVP